MPEKQRAQLRPFELRARLGFDAPVQLSSTVNDCRLRFYERALQPRIAALPAFDGPTERRRKLLSGTITVVRPPELRWSTSATQLHAPLLTGWP